METFRIAVNGEQHTVPYNASEPQMLVDFLRQSLHLTGTKVGCNAGGCGACTVMLTERGGGHRPVLSCLTPLALAQDCHVTTIEAVAHGAEGCGAGASASPGQLHPIQRQFAEGHASQCGFCTPVRVRQRATSAWLSSPWLDLSLVAGVCSHRVRSCHSTHCYLVSPRVQLRSISSRAWPAICVAAPATAPSLTLQRRSRVMVTASGTPLRVSAVPGRRSSSRQRRRQIWGTLTATVVGTPHLGSKLCVLRR